jgi:hypothetical protein
MAALDFPNSPTLNQQYAAPNGVTYQWDGAAWIVTGGPPGQLWTASGATLVPTDATKSVAVLGDATSGAIVTGGRRTAKGRIVNNPTGDAVHFCFNRTMVDPADDATLPTWSAVMGGGGADNFRVLRSAVGASPVSASSVLLTLDNLGALTLPGDTASQSKIVLGTNAAKARIQTGNTTAAPWIALGANRDGYAGTVDDSTKPGWQLTMNANSDNFLVGRQPASGSYGNLLVLDNAGNLTLTGKLNAPALVGARNSAAQTGGAWSTYNTALDVISQTITTKGGLVIITVNMNLSYIQLGASGNVLVDQFLLRDGAGICEVPRNIGGAVVTPLPAFTWVDNPAAGLHTYKLQIWIGSGTSASVQGTAGNPGTLMMQEIGA